MATHQLACVEAHLASPSCKVPAPQLLGWTISWASLKPQFLITKPAHSGKCIQHSFTSELVLSLHPSPVDRPRKGQVSVEEMPAQVYYS